MKWLNSSTVHTSSAVFASRPCLSLGMRSYLTFCEGAALVAPKETRRYRSKPVGPSPPAASGAVSASMKSNKASGTGPEVSLSKALHKGITKSSLPGSPDFVFRRERVAVFVNGCYWHRCPIHAKSLPKTHTSFWRRKFERNIERDRLNRSELESMGWTVLDVWEHEVKEDPASVAQRVKTIVQSRS